MGHAVKKTKKQQAEEDYELHQRHQAQALLREAAQARQEALGRPEGYTSDPQRYFMQLVIPVQDRREGAVADFVVYKMVQRLAGVIEIYSGYPDGYPDGGWMDYLRAYGCNLIPQNQRPDEEVRALILRTLRDLGLESLGIVGAEVVRREYDDWEGSLLTGEELAAKNAESQAQWKAEREARHAEWEAGAERRRAEEEVRRREWEAQQAKDDQLYKQIHNALALIAPQGQKRVSVHEGVITVEVHGAEPLGRLRNLVEQVPGLKVEWLKTRSTKGWTRVRARVMQYPGDEFLARPKARRE